MRVVQVSTHPTRQGVTGSVNEIRDAMTTVGNRVTDERTTLCGLELSGQRARWEPYRRFSGIAGTHNALSMTQQFTLGADEVHQIVHGFFRTKKSP